MKKLLVDGITIRLTPADAELLFKMGNRTCYPRIMQDKRAYRRLVKKHLAFEIADGFMRNPAGDTVALTRVVPAKELADKLDAKTYIVGDPVDLLNTRDEQNLLLYLETRAVDHAGKLDNINMNDTDREILKKWADSGFVESGRICFEDCKDHSQTTWCKLSEIAWSRAAILRKLRGERGWENKRYTTTAEKQLGSLELDRMIRFI